MLRPLSAVLLKGCERSGPMGGRGDLFGFLWAKGLPVTFGVADPASVVAGTLALVRRVCPSATVALIPVLPRCALVMLGLAFVRSRVKASAGRSSARSTGRSSARSAVA